MKVHRVEIHNIKKSNEMFHVVDELCFKSKNLYNYANYMLRQDFFENKKYRDYYDMKKILKTHDPYKDFGSQSAQQTLVLLDHDWKSFFKAIKEWSKNKSKFLGKPKPPKYKKKDGRHVVMLTGNQFRIEDGILIFSWKPLRQFKIPTRVKDKLVQLRFIPKGSSYTMEIVYETEVPDCNLESNRIIGIDLGVNNFATVSNNVGLQPFIINGRIIKSINQYYNKKKAKLQSDLQIKNNQFWSNRLQQLTDKRSNKVKHFLHKASRYIVDWCLMYEIDTVVIGRNKFWKQESDMGKINNQKFVYIPYEIFIKMLKYKCENNGITFIETEESYTSGTSFLDGELPIKSNYNKNRRITRGLFKSNTGIIINADLNGAYQIIKKVFANAFADAIQDVHLHPIRLNII